MATQTVNDFLVEHAPVVGNDINQKMLEQPTPWINLYTQEFWEDQKSSVQKTYTFDRAIVTDSTGTEADPVDWANMVTDASDTNNGAWSQAAYTDSGNSGIPPADYVKYTQTIRDYNLQHKAIWGPPMNTNMLRDKFERVKQVDATVKAVADQQREFWVDRKRDEYTRVADNLVVLDSGFSLVGGDYDKYDFPHASGTDSSILTQGFLDEIYEYMNIHGAGKNPMGYADNRPVYGLVTSARQGSRLIMSDPDIREDFRCSSQNEKLLAPMGVKYTYNGFTYMSDDMIRRWEKYHTAASGADDTRNITTFAKESGNMTAIITLSSDLNAGTTLNTILGRSYMTRFFPGTQITPSSVLTDDGALIVVKKTGATTYRVKKADGTAFTEADVNAQTIYFKAWCRVPQFVVISSRRKPNPDWLIATWEDSYVFHQGTCTSLVPRPITSVGRANFSAINYSGEIKWTNYDDKDNNPDGTVGQFRCIMANGTRPDNPEFGIVIRHLAVPRPDGRIMGENSLG